MKKLLSLILALFLSASAIEAIETQTDPPSGSSVIVLHGELDCNAGPDSAEAFLCKNFVQVCFHQNFGYVSVTLMGDTGGMVYSGTVNTAVQQTVNIPLAGTPSGNYTLILNNVTGMAAGEFAK